MDTGEVFAWLTFLIIITLLFFAAFGSSEVSEQKYRRLYAKINERPKERKRR